MSVSETDIELIERSLSGDLSDGELKQVKERRASSESFDAEYRFQQSLTSHVVAVQKSELKAQMLADFKEVMSEKPTPVRNWRKPMIWAAAAVVMLLATFYFITDTPLNSQQVFDSYYQAYDGVVVPRGDDRSLAGALLAYNDGNYAVALEAFLMAKEYEISTGQLYLLTGSCYLGMSQPEQALEWFGKVPDSETSAVKYNRDWYLALTYLALERTDDSKRQLLQIADSNSIYSDKATELLEEPVFN